MKKIGGLLLMLPLLAVIVTALWWASESEQIITMLMWVLSTACTIIVCLTWLGMLMILVHLFDRGFKMAAKKKGR